MKPMTANEYRAAIAALGLSQGGAAAFLGCAPRTSRKWALSESPVPSAAALLLRFMLAWNVTPDAVRAAVETRWRRRR